MGFYERLGRWIQKIEGQIRRGEYKEARAEIRKMGTVVCKYTSGIRSDSYFAILGDLDNRAKAAAGVKAVSKDPFVAEGAK